MRLHTLKRIGKPKKIQIGRGIGSKRGGHTVGRGTKGQKSRSGYNPPGRMFEGGQNYLSKRIPKLRGFSRRYAQVRFLVHVINVSELDLLPAGTKVTQDMLKNMLDIPKSKKIKFKILGLGEISKKILTEGVLVSQSAREKIEKAGGSVQ